MEGLGIYSLVISAGAFLGVVATALKLFSDLAKKAQLDGARWQRQEDTGERVLTMTREIQALERIQIEQTGKLYELEKDTDGIGSKVNHLQNDHNKVNDKVIELESKVLTKLDGIEALLKSHIDSDNARGR